MIDTHLTAAPLGPPPRWATPRRQGLVGALCLAAVALAAVLAAGCEREQPTHTPDGRLIVRYWEKWGGWEADAMQAVVDDFNASQDRIHVEMMQVSQPDQKLILATAGGTPPDVAGLWSYLVPSFAEKGALTPLNRYLDEAGVAREDYIPALWDLCQHRGFTWALPTTPASVALHWNRRLFREAGLDPDRPPRTIAELDAMAERLTIVSVQRGGERVEVRYPELTDAEKAAKDFTIVQLGFSPHEPGWWKQMWGYWFGARLWDGEDRITAASDANVAAFEWIASYTAKYGVKNMLSFGESFGNFASPQNPFLDERVAMEIQGTWMYNFIVNFAPNLDWAAAPMPSADPERFPGVTIVECDVLVIPTGAPNPDAAFEFIRFVNTQPAMEKLVLGHRKFSALREYSDGFIAEHPNPYIKTFIDLAHGPGAQTSPTLATWEQYEDELIVAADRVFRHIAEPRPALEYAGDRAQRALDRVLRMWEATGEQRQKEWARR